jgi:Zn-dependent peptidase ImmA (M78 family)
MSTWTQAHRIANLAAAQAHRDLGIDTNCFPIDVYRAIEDAGMVLMWRPLPRLFGWYFAGPRPGILLNNQLDYGSQRHTAAHELGHHILGHGTRADLDLDPLTDRRAGWTEVEKTAEAFASWFLMPRHAVLKALSQLGRERIEEPVDVYLLSLLLGTPYRSTVRHLPNLRLISRESAQSWLKVPPNRIKSGLDPGVDAPHSRKPDVWVINRSFADSTITMRIGDRLVVELDESSDQIDGPPGLRKLPAKRTPVMLGAARRIREVVPALFEVVDAAPESGGLITVWPVSGDKVWVVGLNIAGRELGITRRWIR